MSITRTIFLKEGPMVRFMPAYQNENIIDHAPAKIWDLRNDDKGLYLSPIREKFKIPTRVFGKHLAFKRIILDAYKNIKEGSLGVLLTGTKGTGKSLLAEDVANNVIDQGFPVIYVEQAIPAKALRECVRQIGPCAVVFEEFSKIYPEKSTHLPDQQDLLTLFSDRSLAKTLFIIVENVEKDISNYIHLRPQRFKYHFEFKKPGRDVFDEIMGDVTLSKPLNSFFNLYLKTAEESNQQYGIDVIECLAEVAKAAHDIEHAMELIQYLNVPHLLDLTLCFPILEEKGEIVTKSSVKANMDGQAGVKLDIHDLLLSNTVIVETHLKSGKVHSNVATIHPEDQDPTSDQITDPHWVLLMSSKPKITMQFKRSRDLTRVTDKEEDDEGDED